MSQTVVVTGASAGIGRATAQLFGARGANVALIARGRAGLEGAARDVEQAGGKALVLPTDVADHTAVEAAAEQVEQVFGPIDVWINVAFTSVFAPFADIGPEEYRRVTDVAYLGFVHGTRAALARMKPRDRGAIVQVGSALGSRSIPPQSAYCGAKHAVNGFTEAVRCELLHEHSNVRITVVQMPAVNTPQFSWVLSRLPRHPQPVPPIYQPEVAARAVVFAADHPRRKQYWGELPPWPRSWPKGRRSLAGPLPGPHRLRLPADPGTRAPRSPPQPLGAPRRRRRHRPRHPRHVRRPVPHPQPAAVVLPARRTAPGPWRRRPCRRRHPNSGTQAGLEHCSEEPMSGRARPHAPVQTVSASAYEIATDAPEADGTLSWSKTVLVLVEVTAAGQRGIGYTYAASACKDLIDQVLAPAISGGDALDVGASWQAMVRAVRNLGRPGLASCAISAVDVALWDLKARLLDLPLCRLLGTVHPQVPIYGSGGFTTYDQAAARRQLERWTDDWNIPRVKIKIGESWGTNPGRDLDRIAYARQIIGPDVELYVDANGGYQRKQAIRMAHAMIGLDVTWFEEPVSSDDLDGLREVRDQVSADVAAGEYGYDLAYFARMVRHQAVDCLQIDATRCGGITEWLRAAAVAAADNLQVSGHCAPNLHAHVAAATANLRHLEYFHDHVRIEGMLFDGALDPHGGTLRPDRSSPGLGLEFKHSDAERFRCA